MPFWAINLGLAGKRPKNNKKLKKNCLFGLGLAGKCSVPRRPQAGLVINRAGIVPVKKTKTGRCAAGRPRTAPRPLGEPDLALGGTHGAWPLENLGNLYDVAPPHQTD